MLKTFSAAAAALALFLSGPIFSSPASAQTTQGPPIAQSDRMAVLHALNMLPDGRGRVMNACDERVAPQFYAVNMGGSVGTAVLVVITGGPNMATCYGDVPGALFLMKREGVSFRQIFAGQGYFVIMPTAHLGAHDVAIGGPGFRFPLYAWNGHDYAATSRSVSDTQLGEGQSFPP